MKKVIAFAGSPRIGGNSDTLLDEWLRGAKEAGAKIEKVYLDQLKISPCRGCDACRTPQATGCFVRDDMQPIYQQLLDADLWVLATPIYWWGPSAQLKLMVDRWYGMMKQHRAAMAQKELVLLITMGDEDLETAQPTIDMFTQACSYLKIKLHTPIVVSAHKKGEILNDPEALRKASSAAQTIIRQ